MFLNDKINLMNRTFGIAVFFLTAGFLSETLRAETVPSRMWYDAPARNWNEALPVGNGRLGGMVFGDPFKERIQLNEESLWAGAPVEAWPAEYSKHLDEVRKLVFAGRNAEAHAYGLKHLTANPTSFRSYEPLGELWLDFGNSGAGKPAPPAYRRELDLAGGIARVTWRQGEATLTREVIASAADDVIAVRVATDKPGTLAFTVSLSRHKDAKTTAHPDGKLHLDGQIIDIEKKDGGYDDNPGGSGPGGAHMRFAGRLQATTRGGSVTADGETLRVTGADEALLVFTAATDYNLALLDLDRSLDPAAKAESILTKACRKQWPALLAAHSAEHRSMFHRVEIDLGGDPANESVTTDGRLDAVKKGGDDPGLIALHFQYGRYLLMGSSRRPGRLPANLQGIWSDSKWAAWEADYHLNINLQMNYWPARTTNLAEAAEPLLDWFELLARKGRESAKRLYGSDGWLSYLATNPFGRISPSASTVGSQFENSSLDPYCGAWMAAELFDHYQFTQDRKFLARLWPILDGASEFVLDSLVTAPDGTLVVCPSTSPENRYLHPETKQPLRITHASTYHMSIVRAVFDATDRAAAVLGTGGEMRKRIAAARSKLPPIRIGPDGRILEWVEPYAEAEPGHRHMSHLIGLHPFDLVTRASPELFEGARKVIEARLKHGGGGTGWSRAWIINFSARLGDGDAAREHYLALLRRSTLPNLFDVCPPFQIDGNLGAPSGLAEMLVQSHERAPGGKAEDADFIIHLLPALPKAWPNGSVSGLTARGGLVADLEWQDGKLTRYRLQSADGRPVKVRLGSEVTTVATERLPVSPR